ncbi:MAG: MFS transporter, partial [Gammaproteobacteria bacterium]|nr:MFS transporter [Gammaproteobacteria bacterium]
MTSISSAPNPSIKPSDRMVIFSSSVGTVFEWYDFYLYGALASVIAKQFFSGLDPTSGYIFALLAFAAGFIVRPLGAVFFGRLGDLVGRKFTFLATLILMGISTIVVGLLPSYASAGIIAPVLLVVMRLCQGLALGGEYGGAATYVAEHAPANKRGLYTSWIQTTATLGLFLSLIVILVVRGAMDPKDFDEWGWRIPFLFSVIPLVFMVYIRLRLNESPAYQRIKAAGKVSKAPLSESFGQWKNLKIVLLALFGLTAGQAVIWYTGQFYALFFLTTIAKVAGDTANILIAYSLIIGTPFFIVFGWLSDKIGRKIIILLGCLLGALTYFTVFPMLLNYANPALVQAQKTTAVTVIADPKECSFQGNPVAREIHFTSSCDIAKRLLAQNFIPYKNEVAPAGTKAIIKMGASEFTAPVGKINDKGDGFDKDSATEIKTFRESVLADAKKNNLTIKADEPTMNKTMMVVLLTYLVILVTMVYGPIAAMLVELFPTRIRYSSLSLPYHIGNGWFGGLLPTTSFAIVAQT